MRWHLIPSAIWGCPLIAGTVRQLGTSGAPVSRHSDGPGRRVPLSTLSGVTNQDSARTASEYDAMAVEYDRHNASGAANSYYERPATIALLGEVNGKQVLDVGCGTGPVTEWLVDHGA